jgi:hypothetical protein
LKRTFPDAFELTTKASDGWVVVRIRLRIAEDSRQPEPHELQNPS